MTNSNLPQDLAGRLQQLRKRQGLSQEELAGHLGVSRQAVSKWETNQALPELPQILAISNFFNVSCDFLLKGTEAAPIKPEEPEPAEPSQPQPLPFSNTFGVACNYLAKGPAQAAEAKAAPSRLPFVINAILWAWFGLLLSWGLWDYWQNNWCALLGLGCACLSIALLALGVSACPAEEKRPLLRRYARWSVWPLAQMGLAISITAVDSRGLMLVPIILLEMVGPVPFLLCWLAWAAICGFVLWRCREGQS